MSHLPEHLLLVVVLCASLTLLAGRRRRGRRWADVATAAAR